MLNINAVQCSAFYMLLAIMLCVVTSTSQWLGENVTADNEQAYLF